VIGWLNPVAFWLLPLVLVPLVIHLLRVHRADRVLFPSLRFVQPSRSAAVRLRLPSDWLLLVLRMSAVALAICAVAQPIVATTARVNGWNARAARAVVLDTSESMRRSVSGGPTAQPAGSEAVAAELKTAASAQTFEAEDLAVGVRRAVAWLASAPPARREIVIVSDFQRGVFEPGTLAGVPDAYGIRLVQVGQPVERQTISGAELIGFDGISARQQTIDLEAESTSVARSPRAGANAVGLRFINPATPSQLAVLMRTIATAGAPVGTAAQPLAIFFTGDRSTPLPSGVSSIDGEWMLRIVLGLKNDRALSLTADASTGTRADVPSPWITVVRDRGGVPAAWGAALQNELVIAIAAPPDSLFAASVVRAALSARHSSDDYAEQEIAGIDAAVLTAMHRPSGPVDANAWRTADSSDGRWLWIVVLVLLGIEQWLRARLQRDVSEEIARAAA
jgi:Aerotolerance regulator N-terminal